MILPEPPVSGCPLRAFPAEVIGVDEHRGQVQIKGDAELLWLHEDPERPWQAKDSEASIRDVLKQTYTLTLGEYCLMHSRRVEDGEVSATQV